MAPQSLAERLDDEAAVRFAHALLQAHLENLFAADEARQRLLDRFCAVVVEDATVISLPAEAAAEWPGCGNRIEGVGQTAVKINIRYELKSGQLRHLTLHPGKEADAPHAADAEELPEGSLHLADLSYFDTPRWLRFATSRYCPSMEASLSSVGSRLRFNCCVVRAGNRWRRSWLGWDRT